MKHGYSWADDTFERLPEGTGETLAESFVRLRTGVVELEDVVEVKIAPESGRKPRAHFGAAHAVCRECRQNIGGFRARDEATFEFCEVCGEFGLGHHGMA